MYAPGQPLVAPGADGALPRLEDFPYDQTWFVWRGPLTQARSPDGNWRSYPHLQDFEKFSQLMLPRVLEFHGLLQLYSVCPDTLECGVCRQAGLVGRQMTACFAQDVVAGGGRHHLKKLWSVALSVGPGLWEEAHVSGGAIRYNYVDGSVEICRGEPLNEASPAAASYPPMADEAWQRRLQQRRLNASHSPTVGDGTSAVRSQNQSRAQASVAAASASLATAVQNVVQLSPGGSRIGSPQSPGGRPRANSDSGLESVCEGYDSEQEDRVVLSEGPIGLEIGPVADGRGAIVQETRGSAAAAGVEVGSQILSINDNPVEDMPTGEIRGMLETENLPITLDLKPPLNLPSLGQRKKRRRDPIIVCTQNCRGSYRVVTDAIEQNGWTEAATDMNTAASVVWLEHADNADGLAPVQTVSRIDAFLHYCKKVRTAQSLNAWLHELPEEFGFSPRTWVLPYDIDRLKAVMIKGKERASYIAKPTAGAQGKGIVLARKWKDLDAIVQKCKDSLSRTTPVEYAVQQYISEPLLLDGLKFDMRVYAIVTSVVPLRAYLFKEGLARFCTVPYEAPQDHNLKQGCMHLTNYALNKKSSDFQQSQDVEHHDEGSKRSITAALHQVESSYGVSADVMWGKIARLVANTLVALRPGLVEWYVHERLRPLHPFAPKGFQILGLDVLIDGEFEPRLLELNANPSLSATQPGPSSPPPEEQQLPDIIQGNASSSSAEPWPQLASTGMLSGIGASAPSFLRGEPSSNRPRTGMLAPVGNASASGIAAAMGGRRRNSRQRSMGATSTGSFASGKSRPGTGAIGGASPPRPTHLGRSRSSVTLSSAPRGAARGSGGSSSPGAPGKRSGTHGGARLRRAMQRSRSRISTGEAPQPEPGMVMSELDLEIKRELVSQALLLSRPAPRNKTLRLRKQWEPRDGNHFLPLDDDGRWTLPGRPPRTEVARQDAPERCPALVPIDFEESAAPRALEFSQAHLHLYRWWARSCGQGKNTLGQEKVLRQLERNGLVGSGAGQIFPDRVSAQLWLSKQWRDLADGAYGLNVPQFMELAGKIGRMLTGIDADDVDGLSHISGILEYMAHGLGTD